MKTIVLRNLLLVLIFALLSATLTFAQVSDVELQQEISNVKENPNDAEALNNLGDAYADLGSMHDYA